MIVEVLLNLSRELRRSQVVGLKCINEIDDFNTIILLEAAISKVYQALLLLDTSAIFVLSLVILCHQVRALIRVQHLEQFLNLFLIVRRLNELLCHQIELVKFLLLTSNAFSLPLSDHLLIHEFFEQKSQVVVYFGHFRLLSLSVISMLLCDVVQPKSS